MVTGSVVVVGGGVVVPSENYLAVVNDAKLKKSLAGKSKNVKKFGFRIDF